MSERYFLGSDSSGHTYAVPVSKRDEWGAWTNLSEDDPDSWEEPDYAIRVEADLTFTDPQPRD